MLINHSSINTQYEYCRHELNIFSENSSFYILNTVTHLNMSANENTAEATYEAGCHCGYISLSVTLSPPLPEHQVTNCNCSICRRTGYLLVCELHLHHSFI